MCGVVKHDDIMLPSFWTPTSSHTATSSLSAVREVLLQFKTDEFSDTEIIIVGVEALLLCGSTHESTKNASLHGSFTSRFYVCVVPSRTP